MPDLKKLRWTLNRLTAMSPAEIVHRVRERGRRRVGRRLLGWERFSCGSIPVMALAFNRDDLIELSRTCGSDWAEVYEQAKTGNWSYLGQDWPSVTEKSVWHLDPVTGGSWPNDRYCFDIDFRHERALGDVKYVWELNRLQFLPPIAALAAVSGDTRGATFCYETIVDWADENPPFSGVNWGSGIELALRAISILITVSLLGPDTFSAEQKERIGTILNAHAIWLMRYPSAYSSANNHLIAEAAALYLLGALVPSLPNAGDYRAYGVKTLEAEAEKQILADGVGAEQSPTYTAFTLELYLTALAAARTIGDDLAPRISDRLRATGTFLKWITDAKGNHPRFGDDDEGRVLTSKPGHEALYVASIMSSLAASTGTPGLAPQVAVPHLRQLFFGSAPTQADAPTGCQNFDAGGYSAFRGRIRGHDTLMILDHGPLGYLSIAAHGHADALAVWLHVDGHPVMIDAGTYLYHSGGAERDRFRGTAAHNTLELESADQSVISGAFNWSHKAKAWRMPGQGGAAGQDESVIVRHDGYMRRFGAVHERRVSRTENGFEIADRLLGAPGKVTRATLRFYLDPQIETRITAAGSVDLARDGKAFAEMVLVAADGAALPAAVVDTDVSPRFGVKEQTRCVTWEVAPERLFGDGGTCLSIRFT